ncbi:MAG: tRNA pseudouridine(55) synthase TruB [Acidobacteria bacterium]|nr:MAG: tRNA pseudouridine(55) synthase TruB [Acidobacteriota bacterium]
MTTGFLLIDKPTGSTAHDVVARIRRSVGAKVGHAGTLDPMATGLLVLGLGGATRLLRFVQIADKEYVATALFGVATDSLDADGAILSREPLPVTSAEVEAAMERFRGNIMQIPPMVSARRVGGRRLYELAREGKIVEREARSVTIRQLELVDLAPSNYPEVTFRTVCTTGTYIRTLADDLAQALGGHAHLTALRRMRIGSLDISQAVTVEEAVRIIEASELDHILVSPSDALSDIPKITVDDTMAAAVRHGRDLPDLLVPDLFAEGSGEGASPVRITDREGKLIAIYRHDRSTLRPQVVLS